MNLPILTGIETEYGILMLGAPSSDPFKASRYVLAQCEEAGELLRRKPERPLNMRGLQVVNLDPGDEGLTAADLQSLESYMAIGGLDYNSLMLPNGARFYIDHAHPEYCTPEAISPRVVVAADKAGEIIVERCRQRANGKQLLPTGQELAIYKNNSDGKGNSYGCHENYMLSAALYEELIKRKFHRTLRMLIPFLVSRAVIIGAGKVGAENEMEEAGFQLTQRADFFETLIGLQTTHNRPLINTRDEAHASSSSYRRLHVILGDANLAEYSTYLKVGMTQLVLMMLEDEAINIDLTLDDPISAYQAISRDLTLSRPLPLVNGGGITALDIQRQFLQNAVQYVAHLAELPGAMRDERRLTDARLAELRLILELWADALEKLSRDWRLLAARLDWCIKRSVLERYLSSQGTDWDAVQRWELPVELTLDLRQEQVGEGREALLTAVRRLPQVRARYLEDYFARHRLDAADYWRQRNVYFTLRQIDLSYHDIRRGSDAASTGMFYRLQNAGAVERLVNDAEVDYYVNNAVQDTRAYFRGHLLSRFGSSVVRADWSEITFREPSWTQDITIQMPDPTALSFEDIGHLLSRAADLPTLIRLLNEE